MTPNLETVPIWAGILFCLSQSAIFSGMNLAVFSRARLELEVEAAGGNQAAGKLLALRVHSNQYLCTILWGNVGINVLLTLLSDSVMLGATAFLFSTFFITVFGEILPQAYFSRNALSMGATFSPVLRFYRLLLFPVVFPSAKFLDHWLGGEIVRFWREKDLEEILRRHMNAEGTELGRAEALGALNFLTMDDLPVEKVGVLIDLESILSFPVRAGKPVFPQFTDASDDPFLRSVERSGKAWVVITDETGEPRFLLDADGFLRHALLHQPPTDPLDFCHKPVVVRDTQLPLGQALERLRADPSPTEDSLVSFDTILVWSNQPRLITGGDLLGRLLRGIVRPAATAT